MSVDLCVCISCVGCLGVEISMSLVAYCELFYCRSRLGCYIGSEYYDSKMILEDIW